MHEDYFLKCFEIVLKNEGFYSNDVADKGGETIFGISRNNFPTWEGWSVVDNCKAKNSLDVLKTDGDFMNLVEAWYKKNFWDVMNLDIISEIDLNLAMEMFDTGVNCNWTASAKWLQRGLNAMNLNQDQKYFKDLIVDAQIGSNTINALKTLNELDRKILIQIMNGLQIAYYISIAENNPSQEKFVRGWVRARTMEKFF